METSNAMQDSFVFTDLAALEPHDDVHAAALADAVDHVDGQLKTQMKNSRRLFYSPKDTSWSHLGFSITHGSKPLDDLGDLVHGDDKDHPEEESDDDDESHSHDKTSEDNAAVSRKYAEFLSSASNLEMLKSNVEQAEDIFYQTDKEYSKDTANPALAQNVSRPRYSLQLFNPTHYDKVEHNWDRKAFTVSTIKTFFGSIQEERMDQVVQSKRRKIAQHGCWDPEGLVLTDLGRPFRCKLLLSVQDESKLPDSCKMRYLSGTWLSLVYRGEYGAFLDWVDDAIWQVHDRYDKKATAHKDFYAFYPSQLENQKESDEALVVFFIKVKD